MCLAAGPSFQAQGHVAKAVVGEGVEEECCLVPLTEEKSPPLFLVFNLALWVFFSPLKEQRGKWSSPQRRRLSKVTTPQSCSTQVSLCLCLALGALVPDPMGGVAGWWGGLCRGLPHLVSAPKSPKPLPRAGFGSHAGKPSSSHRPGTTLSCFAVQWLRPACRVPSPMGGCCQPGPCSDGCPRQSSCKGSSTPA